VVIGKHQNALAEINYPFVIKNNIKVARRISGGGTVFHDSGNINFAYIKNIKDSAEINFSQFTQPVVDSLAKLNLKAASSGHNDLLIDEKKISGNAEHIYKNRVLHHGTLLFNSDLEILGKALASLNSDKYTDKAVQSRRSTVANISQYLNNNWTVKDFSKFLFDIQLENPAASIYSLSEKDQKEIDKLYREKFRTWEWNYGYSPKYVFANTTEIDTKNIAVILKVEKGIITEGSVSGDYFSNEDSSLLTAKLKNIRHNYEDIRQLLTTTRSEVPDKLIFAFF